MSTLILDPADDLAASMGWIEDRLLWSDPEPGQEAIIVRAGARGAAAISQAVTEATAEAPELYAPGGRHELAPLPALPGDLETVLAAVQRAVHLTAAQGPDLPTEWRHHAQALRSLDLLRCCDVASRSACAEPIRDAVRSAVSRAVLTDVQYRSYRWFTTALLTDPLDRFVALGNPSPSLDHSHRLERGGVGL